MVLLAIIRLRGRSGARPEVRYTLRLLRLTRRFHAVIYPSSLPGIEGMLKVVKDWVTWGEISKDVLKELIVRRGRTIGNKPITDEFVKTKLKIDGGIDELVDLVYNEKIYWHRLDNLVKPIFRLHPPKGGFKGSIKKPYKAGGELGYRGSAINELLLRMI
ncbi:MAG TPA: 50S ribosomal protein L30 [Acidilobales archaeon]|nr:50S ribosomal protein L30 [Acidilobales archaeon]